MKSLPFLRKNQPVFCKTIQKEADFSYENREFPRISSLRRSNPVRNPRFSSENREMAASPAGEGLPGFRAREALPTALGLGEPFVEKPRRTEIFVGTPHGTEFFLSFCRNSANGVSFPNFPLGPVAFLLFLSENREILGFSAGAKR